MGSCVLFEIITFLIRQTIIWEVLKGVGVDGAGGNLPFFFAFLRFSSLLLRESPFFLRFFRLILGQGANDCNFLEKWGKEGQGLIRPGPWGNRPNS